MDRAWAHSPAGSPRSGLPEQAVHGDLTDDNVICAGRDGAGSRTA